MLRLLYLPLIIFAGLFLYVRLLERTSVFAPTKVVLETPRSAGLDFSDVTVISGGRYRLHGWFVPAAGPEPRSTLLFLHGNAGNIGDRIGKIALFHRMGLNVFIFDYRGYGNSEGRPTEEGMYQDAEAAYDTLTARPDVNPDTVFLYGASLGGVAAVDLAIRRKVPSLVLDSTFTSAADMGRVILPVAPSFLLSIRLDSVHKIQRVGAPKLFIHSPEDETVPYALGRKLYEAAPGPKAFLEISGSHNNGHVASQQKFYDGVRAFLTEYGLLST
jgi:hypothetical protein